MTVIERLNARELEPADLPFAPDLATVDVSFISLTKVLPAVAGCLAPGGEVLAMVKPQFELGRERVRQGRRPRCGRPPRGDPRWSPRRRASSACRCAASPPPACPARRATARPSSGAAGGARRVADLEAAVRGGGAMSDSRSPRADHPLAPAGRRPTRWRSPIAAAARGRLAAGRDRGGAGQARRRRRPASSGRGAAPPGRPLPGARRRRLDPLRAAPLRPHRRPGVRRQLRHGRFPRRGRARRGRGGARAAPSPARSRRSTCPAWRSRSAASARSPSTTSASSAAARAGRRAELQDRRRGGRQRALRRPRRRDARRLDRLQPRQPGPDPSLGREGLRGQLHLAPLADRAGAGRRPRRRPARRQRRRAASRSTSPSTASTPASSSPGAALEVRFADGVGRLAQLPGTSFYQRIREKFGHLAV